MRIVFDLDDTISVHRNRDFENAKPIKETIEKIRKLKAEGCEIIIYTARGQNSCNGDINLIESRNRKQIEEWLTEHDVPFDHLYFGKPLGDLYVDDKGVSLESFLGGKYERLSGNSGAEIFRLGDKVSKKCNDAQRQADWYRKAAISGAGICVPAVYSVVVDTITMEYIHGKPGYTKPLTDGQMYDVFKAITVFSKQKGEYRFDVNALISRAKDHLDSVGADEKFVKLFDSLRENEKQLSNAASFCHGDLSLSNMIFFRGIPFFIDPIINDNYSSYLLDNAKLRFSLDGGERYLHGDEAADFSENLIKYDAMLAGAGIRGITKAIEAIYWIRLLKYAKDEKQRQTAIAKAKSLEGELW